MKAAEGLSCGPLFFILNAFGSWRHNFSGDKFLPRNPREKNKWKRRCNCSSDSFPIPCSCLMPCLTTPLSEWPRRCAYTVTKFLKIRRVPGVHSPSLLVSQKIMFCAGQMSRHNYWYAGWVLLYLGDCLQLSPEVPVSLCPLRSVAAQGSLKAHAIEAARSWCQGAATRGGARGSSAFLAAVWGSPNAARGRHLMNLVACSKWQQERWGRARNCGSWGNVKGRRRYKGKESMNKRKEWNERKRALQVWRNGQTVLLYLFSGWDALPNPHKHQSLSLPLLWHLFPACTVQIHLSSKRVFECKHRLCSLSRDKYLQQSTLWQHRVSGVTF